MADPGLWGWSTAPLAIRFWGWENASDLKRFPSAARVVHRCHLFWVAIDTPWQGIVASRAATPKSVSDYHAGVIAAGGSQAAVVYSVQSTNLSNGCSTPELQKNASVGKVVKSNFQAPSPVGEWPVAAFAEDHRPIPRISM